MLITAFKTRLRVRVYIRVTCMYLYYHLNQQRPQEREWHGTRTPRSAPCTAYTARACTYEYNTRKREKQVIIIIIDHAVIIILVTR